MVEHRRNTQEGEWNIRSRQLLGQESSFVFPFFPLTGAAATKA